MADIVDLMDMDESDSKEVEVIEPNHNQSAPSTDPKPTEPAPDDLMSTDQTTSNTNTGDSSSEIPNLAAYEKGVSIHEYKANYALCHPNVVPSVPLHELLTHLSKLDKRVPPLLHDMLHRQASSEQLTYFRAVLQDHLKLLLDQARMTGDVKYWHITDSRSEWAKPYRKTPLFKDPDKDPLKETMHFDEAHFSATKLLIGAHFLAEDDRRQLHRCLSVMQKRYQAVRKELHDLKHPPPPIPADPPPKKPARWIPPRTHPVTRAALLPLIRNPSGDIHLPPSPAEEARPWSSPWLMHAPGTLPDALFLLWDHRASTMATGHNKGHALLSGARDTLLLSDAARREALYTHCNRAARHSTPFVSATSSLAQIILVEQWRLKADYIVDGTLPLLYLTVISPFARMLDGFPVLRFTDELAHYAITHPAMEETSRGTPVFEHEFILPFSVAPSHIVGTWPLKRVQDQCRRDWYTIGKSEWADAFRGAKSKLGDLMAHAVARKSEERWYREYSIEPWFEREVMPELRKCVARAKERTEKVCREVREREELGGAGVKWDRDGW